MRGRFIIHRGILPCNSWIRPSKSPTKPTAGSKSGKSLIGRRSTASSSGCLTRRKRTTRTAETTTRAENEPTAQGDLQQGVSYSVCRSARAISVADSFGPDPTAVLRAASLPKRPMSKRFTCPNCGDRYEPEYEDRDDAPPRSVGREQHQTGLCSDECWNEFLGLSEDGR